MIKIWTVKLKLYSVVFLFLFICLGALNIDFGSIQLPGGSGQPQPTHSSRREDDPKYIMDMLLSNPSQLAILKERNPPLADAVLSRDLGKSFHCLWPLASFLHNC